MTNPAQINAVAGRTPGDVPAVTIGKYFGDTWMVHVEGIGYMSMSTIIAFGDKLAERAAEAYRRNHAGP